MTPPFRLVMFGGLALLRDGSPVSGALGQRKRLALLGLLAASPNGLARDTALAMLWPESDEERARNSLSQLVHGLRREIGETVIRGKNSALTLDPEAVSSDVADFRRCLANGDHAAAVELYRGSFLEGVYLREAPAFERWCEERRLEFARLYMASLEHLAQTAAQRGDRAAAVEWRRRCADADPLSGRIARRYMEALAADAKREEAIRHAELYTERVRSDLDAEPDAGVVAFASELRGAKDRVSARSIVRQDKSGPEFAPNAATTGPLPPATVDAAATSSPELRPGVPRRTPLASNWARYAAVVAVIGVALAAISMMRTPAPVDRRVVVAAFENRTGNSTLDQLGFITADGIAQGLQRTNLTEVVDPATALLASRHTRSERLPLGDAREVRALASKTHARLVVTGSYYREADSLVMVARISDARDERLLDALMPVRVPMHASVSAVEPVRDRVLGALAMRLDERLDPIVPAGSSPPPTYDAYLEFMQGLDAYQRQDRQAAIRFFSSASAADSTFVLPLVWKVWALGGRSAGADSILRRLSSKRELLAPLDRAAVDYQLASARNDLRAQATAAAEAARLAPGSHWAHNLGNTLTSLHRLDEAIAAFEQIDRRKGWTRGWFPFWERFIVTLHVSDKHDRELEIAREARRALPSAPLAVYFEARALAAMGKTDELESVIKEVAAFKENADSLGKWLSLLARELETSGDTVAANQMHTRAVSWFATLPSEKRVLSAYQLQFAIALYRGGRYAEARPVFESLIADPARNRRDANFDPHAYLGGVYAYLGDHARADSVIRVLQSDNRPGAARLSLHWSARIAAAMGDKERAVDYLRRQVAQSGAGGSFHFDNRDLDGLLDYPPYRALVEMREKSTPQALSSRQPRTR